VARLVKLLIFGLVLCLFSVPVFSAGLINDRIVDWWDFDQGTGNVIINKVTPSRNLTLLASTANYSWSTDKDSDFNSSLDFDGTTANGSLLATYGAYNNFSTIVLYKMDSGQQYNLLFTYARYGFVFSWGTYANFSGSLPILTRLGGATEIHSSNYSFSSFMCVATVKSTGFTHLYNNGDLVNSSVTSAMTTGASTYKIMVGGYGPQQFYRGKIQQIIFVNRSLNATEISGWCADPKPYASAFTPTDTCTYSGTGNWNILMTDRCNITTANNLGRSILYLNGTGSASTDRLNISSGTITNYSEAIVLVNAVLNGVIG
jgi:hypothetical protein